MIAIHEINHEAPDCAPIARGETSTLVGKLPGGCQERVAAWVALSSQVVYSVHTTTDDRLGGQRHGHHR